MAAPESTKFQVNYKLADGTLLNIYAISQAELEASQQLLPHLVQQHHQVVAQSHTLRKH